MENNAQSYWPAQGWCVMFKSRSWRVKTGSAGEIIFLLLLLTLFTVTFQPSRDATITWFRSSFIQTKDEELERYKIKREKAYKSHILTKKTRKTKRNLRTATLVADADMSRVKKMLSIG